MPRFLPLLSDRDALRLPAIQVLGFCLQRYGAGDSVIGPHQCSYSQVMVFLTGHGRYTLGSGAFAIEPGVLVALPAGTRHAFERTGNRAPLCLIIKFRISGIESRPASVRTITRADLLRVRQTVARLLRLPSECDGANGLERLAMVLSLLTEMLRVAGWLAEPANDRPPAASNPAIRRLVSSIEPDAVLGAVVRRSGYNRDYLNRLVKRDTGLTLGQWRDRQRLDKAKELLSSGMRVGSAAAVVGLPDQGYFARWFRRQTGHPPSHWVRSARAADTIPAA